MANHTVYLSKEAEAKLTEYMDKHGVGKSTAISELITGTPVDPDITYIKKAVSAIWNKLKEE